MTKYERMKNIRSEERSFHSTKRTPYKTKRLNIEFMTQAVDFEHGSVTSHVLRS